LIQAYDKAHPGQTAAEVGKALGLSQSQIWNSRFQTRRAGGATAQSRTKKGKPPGGEAARLQIARMILEVGVDEVREVLRFMTGQ
jgi:hypothetical protein